MNIITDHSVTIFDSLKPVTVTDSHHMFEDIKELVSMGNYDEALNLIDNRRTAKKAITNTDFELVGDCLYLDDYRIPDNMASRIFDLTGSYNSVKPLEKFFRNLLSNPSYRAVQELYGFLELSKLPITDDGHFVAYKAVNYDYRDCYTGTMDNSIGAQPTMPRNLVDEDKNRTCSAGLHFAGYEYARGFVPSEGHLMAVRINPKDVVAIPSDYNNMKGRASTYTIVNEIEGMHDTLTDTPLYKGDFNTTTNTNK
tara:strand:- start:4719 stop:5480 length:762 start_codon:yes stop_codon:yes gene_type:complete